MGTTKIKARCYNEDTDAHEDYENKYKDDTREFWVTIEFKGPEQLRELAEETCPECGSEEWKTTDLARNR